MRLLPLLSFLLLIACRPVPVSVVESNDPDSFRLDIVDELKANILLTDGVASCTDCSLTFGEAAGRPAWKLTSQIQFSDAYFDLAKLFNHPFDLTGKHYLTYDIYIPEASYFTTVNTNFMAPDGSTAGCGDPVNNFLDNRGTWQRIRVDLAAQQAKGCGRWHGATDPLPQVAKLSINPYNGNLHAPSTLYFNNIQLHQTPPDGTFMTNRMPRVDTTNFPFEIDFENERHLRHVMAYRGFETKNHALTTGKFGNASRALVNHSFEDDLSYWLIKMQYFTGSPVDLTQADSLVLRYYLTPESDPIDHTELFLVSGHDWDNILYDTLIDYTWQPGAWTRVAFALDDFNFQRVRGEGPVLSEATEFRFDFKPRGGQGELELWLDDVGWK